MITDTMRNANTQKGHMEELKEKTLKEEKDLNRFTDRTHSNQS